MGWYGPQTGDCSCCGDCWRCNFPVGVRVQGSTSTDVCGEYCDNIDAFYLFSESERAWEDLTYKTYPYVETYDGSICNMFWQTNLVKCCTEQTPYLYYLRARIGFVGLSISNVGANARARATVAVVDVGYQLGDSLGASTGIPNEFPCDYPWFIFATEGQPTQPSPEVYGNWQSLILQLKRTSWAEYQQDFSTCPTENVNLPRAVNIKDRNDASCSVYGLDVTLLMTAPSAYLRPNGVDYYRRPNGFNRYWRP